MTQIVITMKVHVNGEAVPVYDIRLGISSTVSTASLFQAHFASEERAPALTKHEAGWTSHV
jgi:hypothetical protein